MLPEKFVRSTQKDICSACGDENATIQVWGDYSRDGKVVYLADLCDDCFKRIHPDLPIPKLEV